MPTLLVVDDVSMDRMLMTNLLQQNAEFTIESVESGSQALERLQTSPPIDLVVTDLTMPEMNGLELVTAVRLQHPEVPVVLATANGSEELAVSALEQGATSYVPKLQLADKLLDTVDQVLAHAQAQSNSQRLMQSLTYADLRFALDQGEALFGQLVEFAQQLVAAIGLCSPAEEVRLGMALEEALRDVMLRGNLGLDDEQMQAYQCNRADARDLVHQRRRQAPLGERRIFVGIRISSDEAQFEVQHEGETDALPGDDLLEDTRLLERAEGRAYVLMRSFLDDVHVDPERKSLTLVKRR